MYVQGKHVILTFSILKHLHKTPSFILFPAAANSLFSCILAALTFLSAFFDSSRRVLFTFFQIFTAFYLGLIFHVPTHSPRPSLRKVNLSGKKTLSSSANPLRALRYPQPSRRLTPRHLPFSPSILSVSANLLSPPFDPHFRTLANLNLTSSVNTSPSVLSDLFMQGASSIRPVFFACTPIAC